MRRTTVAPSTEPEPAEEMSAEVLAIIGAYRMGRVVEADDLCQRPIPETQPEAPPRPAEGYIRNGVYHVAGVVSSSAPPIV